jgi:hypothetical protein
VSRKTVDWERVEQQFRAGLLSLREIAEANGCSHVAVTKRAKAHGWERDLAAKIKAKAEALVNRAAVNSAVNEQRVLTDKALIEANAANVANVSLRHRSDLIETLNVARAMLAELRSQGEHGDALDTIAEMLSDPDADENRLRQALQRAISLPSRATALKSVADTILKAIDAERANYKLDDPAQAQGVTRTLTDAERASRLASIMERARQAASAAAPAGHAVH